VQVDGLRTIALWAAAVVLILRFFNAFVTVGLGLLAAASVAAGVRPLRRVFPGPRWWSAMIAGAVPALFAVVFLGLLSWLLSAPIQREISRLPQLQDTLNRQAADWSARVGLAQPVTVQQVLGAFAGFMDADTFSTAAGAVSNLFISTLFLFFGAVYLLAAPPGRLVGPLLALLSPDRADQCRRALADLEPRLRWWLIGSLIAMGATGAASWIGYRIIGLQFAAPLAILAGASEIVPTIGPVIAFLFALLFAAAEGGGKMAAVIAVYLVIQTLESYILQPIVMKKAVDMPPVVTLFTVILWSKVFGAPGLILAIPINLVIWTFVDRLFLHGPGDAEAVK
jgi:predicted PurR-regulated permease PerM